MQIVLWIFAGIGFSTVVFILGLVMMNWIIPPQSGEDETFHLNNKQRRKK